MLGRELPDLAVLDHVDSRPFLGQIPREIFATFTPPMTSAAYRSVVGQGHGPILGCVNPVQGSSPERRRQCDGNVGNASHPDYPGRDRFSGRQLHTRATARRRNSVDSM
jgi:hypothetical protein